MRELDEDIEFYINTQNFMKYSIMLVVLYLSATTIPNCNVMKKQALQIALLGVTTFVILDTCFPRYISV